MRQAGTPLGCDFGRQRSVSLALCGHWDPTGLFGFDFLRNPVPSQAQVDDRGRERQLKPRFTMPPGTGLGYPEAGQSVLHAQPLTPFGPSCRCCLELSGGLQLTFARMKSD